MDRLAFPPFGYLYICIGPEIKKKQRTFVLTIMRSRPCALSTFSRFMTAGKQLVLAIYGSHSQAEKAGKIWENLKETVTQSTR